jgi:putative transposase
LWIVKQVKKGRPIEQIALAQKVSRMTVWNVRQAYKKYGEDGLRDHRPGRLFEPLCPKFYNLVKDEWKIQHCGARKLHAILSRRGFGVSLRKISQVMKKEGFQKPCPKRQKPRRYKRYEWPLPNWMWHTDWYELKDEKQLIVYIDDCSRKIMSHGVFEHATTQNARFVLYKAIVEHETIPVSLNSDRGAQFIANKRDKDGNADHEFEKTLEELGIQFIPSRRRHPQTNGKNERWNGILAQEYDERFASIDEFIDWYNDKRASEALDYKTPNQVYKEKK